MVLIGFYKLRERFLKAILNDTLSHAHILIGPDGIGKSLLAETVAREILGFGDRDSVDIIRVRPEKTIITVNQVREVVLEASLKPYEGQKKVIIFYEADRIGQEGQNALLKTIEEPMEGVFFFLLSENEMFMRDTIKSRCHLHKLMPMDAGEMKAFVEAFVPSHNAREEKRVQEETLKLSYGGKKGKVEPPRILQVNEQDKAHAISLSRGIPGRAEEILLSGGKDLGLEQVLALLLTLAHRKKQRSPEVYPVLSFVEILKETPLEAFFDDFIFGVHGVLKKKSLDEEVFMEASLQEKMDVISRELTFSVLEKYLEVFFDMRKYIQRGVNIHAETVLNSVLLRLAGV